MTEREGVAPPCRSGGAGLTLLAPTNGVWSVMMKPKATLYGAHIVSGFLLGSGIALAGACPRTVLEVARVAREPR